MDPTDVVPTQAVLDDLATATGSIAGNLSSVADNATTASAEGARKRELDMYMPDNVSDEHRKRLRNAVRDATAAGDSSLAHKIDSQEVLVDFGKIVLLNRMVRDNEHVSSAVRILCETLFNENVSVLDEHGGAVPLPDETITRLSNTTNEIQGKLLRMRLVMGVCVVGYIMVPVYDPASGKLLLTEAGEVRMRPLFWVPQFGTFAVTTWKCGSTQRYRVYEYIPQKSALPSNLVLLGKKMTSVAMGVLRENSPATVAAGLSVGTFVHNPDLVVLDYFGTSPDPLTGALNSRLAASNSAFMEASAMATIRHKWNLESVRRHYIHQEYERISGIYAVEQAKPDISSVTISLVSAGAVEDASADAGAGPADPSSTYQDKRVDAMASAVQRATLKSQMLQDADASGARHHMTAPGVSMKAQDALPSMKHLSDDIMYYTEVGLVAIGVNSDLLYTRAGRSTLGYVAVAMETFRNGLNSLRKETNRINDDLVVIARRAVKNQRAINKATRNAPVVWDDLFEHGNDPRMDALLHEGDMPTYIRYAAASGTNQPQGMQFYSLSKGGGDAAAGEDGAATAGRA